MPKILPPQWSEFTESSAEKRLFSVLKNMPDTDDWTVLHSVGIAKHVKQTQGEADFVVVIPSVGTFVLEVKGGGISQENGTWFSVDRNDIKHIIKNPYEEANTAMHSLKKYLIAESEIEDIGKTVFGFGVVFPSITVHGQLVFPDVADEQIADCDDCGNAENFKQYLLRLAHFWKKRNSSQITLDATHAKEIVNLLRPDFVGRMTLASQIRTVEQQLITLTDNQQSCFDTITENERCVIKGSAGTGKTVIALEHARRLCDEGHRIALFCYNRQLASYLNENKGYPDIVCGSFTEYMESIALQGGKDVPDVSEKDTAYYRETLPQLFTEAFIDLEISPFDVLILDEAQDLMTETYLDVFDIILEGGINEGRWYFFLDAEKQNLYHASMTFEDIKLMLKNRKSFFTVSSLTDNCRNSVAIIEKLDAVFGTKTKHRSADERGADVEIKTYKKALEQGEELEKLLRTLEREGVSKSEITVLSPLTFKNSVAMQLDSVISATRSDKHIFFSTIQAFKGLESPVIILTDIESLDRESQKHLLYVGMTRAKTLLYILANKTVSKYLIGN